MLRRLRQQSGARAVRHLPIPAPVAGKVTCSRNAERREDEKQKNEHEFLHEGELRGPSCDCRGCSSSSGPCQPSAELLRKLGRPNSSSAGTERAGNRRSTAPGSPQGNRTSEGPSYCAGTKI